MTGLIVALVVLVLGGGIGLWWRRTDGRFHPVGAGGGRTTAPERGTTTAHTAQPVAARTDAAVTAEPSAATAHSAAGSARRTGPAGRAVSAGPVAGAAGPAAVTEANQGGDAVDGGLLEGLGVRPSPATLLQFSTAFCAPCRAVRRVSSEVAAMIPGVRHVEVDAESHLDAVRALNIWRTPTLLVLDGDGRVTKRATGVPSKPQLIAVLAEILPDRTAPDQR